VTATAEGVEPFHILRTYSHRKELGRSKVLTAIFRNGHYDRLREPVFLFDGNADCISLARVISAEEGVRRCLGPLRETQALIEQQLAKASCR
jgi:hypothetical protein